MCTSHCFTGCGAGCPQSVLNRAGRRSTGQRIGLPKLSNFPHRDHRSADRDHPPIDCHGRRSRGLLRCGLQHRRGDSLGRHWPVRRGCPRCALDTDKSGHKGPARSGSPHCKVRITTLHKPSKLALPWRAAGAASDERLALATVKAAKEKAKMGRKKWFIGSLRGFDFACHSNLLQPRASPRAPPGS